MNNGGNKPQMNSEEINAAIIKLDDHGRSKNEIYHSCIGDKIIPYIGWFWRPVNFDRDFCQLGVLPIYESRLERNNKVKVGFMENNKWGYDMFKVEGEQWKTLKELIINAVKKKDSDGFGAVDSYMQSLLPKIHRK